jgi:hypothetical protein
MSKVGRPARRRLPQKVPAKPRPTKSRLIELELRERFKGRPLLLIFEAYVLSVIGAFSADRAATMDELVQAIWGGDADWVATLRRELMDDSMDAQISSNWVAYQAAMKEQGRRVDPTAFARMFADALDEQTRKPK